jgi:hypothetical protein
METKKTIQSNEELYGDFELIPLPYDAVEQRINFFRDKIAEEVSIHFMDRDNEKLNKYMKASAFWIEIRDKHCLQESA